MVRPLVSVVIPSYNHAPYVEATIGSALSQSLSDLELIIIDDGSEDDSVACIQHIMDQRGDCRVRLITRENRGLPRTLNEGLVMARGKYFAYLGSDDLWEPDKVEKQVLAMESAGRHVGASFTDCFLIDSAGQRLDRLGRQYGYRGGDIYHDLVQMAFHPPSPTNLFVREKLIAVGGFNEDIPVEDRDVWLRLARHYSVIYVPEPLASFRVHLTNTSTTRLERMMHSNLYTFAWAFRTDPSLRPLRRRIRSILMAGYGAAYYNALDFPRARRKAVEALRIYPMNSLAWRITVRSVLGSSIVKKVRDFRASQRRLKELWA